MVRESLCVSIVRFMVLDKFLRLIKLVIIVGNRVK